MNAHDTRTGATDWRELETPRLRLREPRLSDAGAMTLYCSDRRVAEMTTSIPHPYLPDMAQCFIEQARAGRHRDEVWVMDATVSEGPELVGIVGHNIAAGEVGYWVGPPFWNTGYATEAVEAVCRHLLEERGLSEILSSVFVHNPASRKVLAKVGFTETGRRPLHSIALGREVDAVTFRMDAG